MVVMGARDMPAMARVLEISVNVVRNFVARGISWSRADEIAVRCGYLPWQIWPEWAQVDPAQWIAPPCPENDGHDFFEPDAAGGEYCTKCHPDMHAHAPPQVVVA
jgi:hypothetical protein